MTEENLLIYFSCVYCEVAKLQKLVISVTLQPKCKRNLFCLELPILSPSDRLKNKTLNKSALGACGSFCMLWIQTIWAAWHGWTIHTCALRDLRPEWDQQRSRKAADGETTCANICEWNLWNNNSVCMRLLVYSWRILNTQSKMF